MADMDYSIEGIEKFVKVDGTVKNVETSRLTAPGENYMSLVLKVDFEVEKNGTTKTFSTVAKRLPLIDGKSDFRHNLMTNEIDFYTGIDKLLQDFAEEEGIQRLDFIPTYCGSRYSLDPQKKEADEDSFLLLENLIPQGFENIDRYNGFNLSEAKAILKRMALFHSIPVVMKIKKPEQFKILSDFMDSNLRHIDRRPPGQESDEEAFGPPPAPSGGNDPVTLLLEALINMPECSQYTDKLKILLNKPSKSPFSPRLGPEPWNTMLHSDLWINNIMISHREEEEPLVKLVDFQVLIYGSYAKDLIFFILTSVDNNVTKTYLDDLLWLYYEEFTSVLAKTNVDLELTFTAFLKEIQRVMIDSEFMHILFFTNPIFARKEDAEDIAVKEFNPFDYMVKVVKNMTQAHRDKLIGITTESARRNWI